MLATLMNEVALLSVSEGSSFTSKKSVEKSLFQMLTSGEETNAKTRELGELIAWHEAGHALCRKVLCRIPVPQVTISRPCLIGTSKNM